MITYIGIDWSSKKHDICFVNVAGAAIARQVIAHTPAGFAEFEHQRQQLGVEPAECVIGIETAHNLVLDYLWGHHYSQVYVIPPNQVNRESVARWPSGARSDPSAAYLLAEMLRHDLTRFPVWRPDSVLTRQMRSRVSLVMHLTHQIVQMSNRLRAVLWRYYPAALTVFSELTAQIELAFILAYPTPQAAAQLPTTGFVICWIEPRGMDADENLVRARLGLRNLTQFCHLRTAISFKNQRTHAYTPDLVICLGNQLMRVILRRAQRQRHEPRAELASDSALTETIDRPSATREVARSASAPCRC